MPSLTPSFKTLADVVKQIDAAYPHQRLGAPQAVDAKGQDYIEVHHRVPVSSMGGAYRVDPVTDLVPVCGNCHAMMHRKNPPLSVEELKAQLVNPKKIDLD